MNTATISWIALIAFLGGFLCGMTFWFLVTRSMLAGLS